VSKGGKLENSSGGRHKKFIQHFGKEFSFKEATMKAEKKEVNKNLATKCL
jgi:phosphopantetheinyl transferase (holo-ACP synthase)